MKKLENNNNLNFLKSTPLCFLWYSDGHIGMFFDGAHWKPDWYVVLSSLPNCLEFPHALSSITLPLKIPWCLRPPVWIFSGISPSKKTKTHGNSTWIFLEHPWKFYFFFNWPLEFPHSLFSSILMEVWIFFRGNSPVFAL